MLVGTLGLIERDRSGLTRGQDLFDFQNLMRISVFGLAAFLLVTALQGTGLRYATRILQDNRLVLSLIVVYLITMSVNILFSDALGLGFEIAAAEAVRSYYFLGEWCLAIAIIYSLIVAQIEQGKRVENICVRLIGTAAVIYISAVMLALILKPFLALGEFNRLGGFIVNPNKLAVVALTAAATGYLYGGKVGKFIGVPALVLIALLTGSRSVLMGGVMGVAAAYMLGAVSVRSRLLRFVVIAVLGSLGVVVALVFVDQFVNLLTRGQSIDVLLTLNSRLHVWSVSASLIVEHPLQGIGYYFGPKHLWNFYTADIALETWRAPHAHNEILNTMLSAGVLAGVIVLSIYVRLVKRASLAFHGKARYLFVFGAVLLLVHSMATPVLSEKLLASGMILIVFLSGIAAKSYVTTRTRVAINYQSENSALT